MSEEPTRSPRGRLTFLLAAAAVLAMAALVRLARWREAYWGSELVPLDGDSLYHLRRSLQFARTLSLPPVDPAVDWPKGAAVPWAPGFDWLCGGVARLFGGPDAPLGRAALAAVPVALGIVVVALAMALAFRVAPAGVRRPAALGAGIVAALLPPAVQFSSFGWTDHHVAEALLVTALALWAVRGVEGASGPWYGMAGAALSAGGVLTFTGTPLYVAIAAVPVALAALFADRPAPFPGWAAGGLLAGAALAAVGTVPQVTPQRALSFAYPSYLQPALVAIVGLGLAAAALASRAGSRRRRAGSLAILVLVVSAGAAAIPGLLPQVRDGIGGFLLARDPWLARVQEFQPVWSVYYGFERTRAAFTWLGLLSPVLAAAGCACCWRERRGPGLALLFLASCAGGLAVLQIRFARPAAPIVGASVGVAAACLLGRLPARRISALLAPAALLLALLGDRFVWAAFAEREKPSLRDSLVGASFDLGRGRVEEPAPGVLVPWDMANEVLLLSDRPVVVNGFGSYPDPAAFEEVDRAYRLREGELVAWMDRRRLGYVVSGGSVYLTGRIPGPGGELPGRQRIALDYYRAVPLAVTMQAGSGMPSAGIPHLQHLLPRFASLQTMIELDGLPVLWTFERVAGARLRGEAPRGTRVVLQLQLLVRGHPHVWQAWADADGRGQFELVVPLPTGYGTATLGTGPWARIRAGEGTAQTVAIPEAAVRSGAEIAVDLRRG
jgi:asparagine N-glycosylation enzyme membrane subunit Stt3